MDKHTLSLLTFVIIVFLSHFADRVNGRALSTVFNSHMVLVSSPSQATLFGWVSASSTITISMNDTSVLPTPLTTTANSVSGFWKTELPAIPASFTPYTIIVSSSDGNATTIIDVLFGYVHLCSGQSNMGYTVSGEFNATTEIALANNYPYIRRTSVSTKYSYEVPVEELSYLLTWRSKSDSVAWFSAVCWHYGLWMFEHLNVPIGLIASAWGGTYIEAWSSIDALNLCPCHAGNLTGNVSSAQANHNYALWNAMIYPLRHLQISSAIWYQGESNTGNTVCYSCMLPAMVSDWRSKFGGQKIPFFVVQLSTVNSASTGYATFRLMQSDTVSKMINAGIATAADLGDINATSGVIHPRNKRTVGERLGHVAAPYFGLANIQSEGPTVEKAVVTSLAPNSTVYIKFTKKSIGLGIEIRPTHCPISSCRYIFEIGTSSGVWIPANYSLVSETIIKLWATVSIFTSNITQVRYAFATWPLMPIYNKDDLPALPFLIQNVEYGNIPTEGTTVKSGSENNENQQSISTMNCISMLIVLICLAFFI